MPYSGNTSTHVHLCRSLSQDVDTPLPVVQSNLSPHRYTRPGNERNNELVGGPGPVRAVTHAPLRLKRHQDARRDAGRAIACADRRRAGFADAVRSQCARAENPVQGSAQQSCVPAARP